MATVQNAQIRQHFIRMGMPKKEIDSIMRDNVIMQKTHIFINKWGLSSIRVDHHVPATYTTRKLRGDIEYREMVFGKDYLTASDYAHEIEHGISDTLYRLDLADERNPTKNLTANEYARRFLYEEGKAEYNRFQFDLRNNPKETKYGSDTAAIKAMNQQQAVDYFAHKMKTQNPSGQPDHTYWTWAKSVFLKETNPNLLNGKTPAEKQKILQSGMDEAAPDHPNRLFGVGDERVRFQKTDPNMPLSLMPMMARGNPTLMVVFVPANSRLADGTVTTAARTALYYSSGGKQGAIEFGIGSAGKSVSFNDNLVNYSKSAYAALITSASRLHSNAVNRLAALVEQQKSEQASGKGKEIHNENEALKALQDLLNKANISLDLQGGVDNLQQNFDQIAKNYHTPLAIELYGEELLTTSVEDGVSFDMDGDGMAEQTAWLKKGSGFLVWDKNGDGMVNDGTEMFGEATVMSDGKRAENGVEALKDLDSDNNNIINQYDELWGKLRIWHDENSNGKTEEGELSLLSDWDIQSISLDFAEINLKDEADNKILFESEVVLENGERRKVADIDFQNDKGIYNELAGEISAETAADVVYPTEISTSVILPGENTAYIPAV